KDPTPAPARWINRRCELRSRRACARGSIHWFSQLLAPQRSTAFSESGGHSVSQIRLGRNNKCTRVKERPGFPVTDCVANGRAFQEQRKERRQKVRGEEGETKEVILGRT